MKKATHPVYKEVIFKDISSNFEILTRSTIQTKDVGTYKGKEYPLFKVEISSASHPFFTGQDKIMDTAGRIDRFNKKYANIKPAAKK